MDMMLDIASAGVSASGSSLLRNVNIALLNKTMDMVELQGEAMAEMIEAVPPSLHMLDVYA